MVGACGGQGTMVAGWDVAGPGLYYVDSDAQRTKGQIFSVGSGSLYAYGILDDGYKLCVLLPDHCIALCTPCHSLSRTRTHCSLAESGPAMLG